MAEPFARIPRRVARYRLSGQVHQVLIAIASHANKEGFAYPSLATIATETDIKRKNLPRLISEAEKCGLLRRERRFKESGAAWNTGYVVFDVGVPNAEDVSPSDFPVSGKSARSVGDPSSNLRRDVLNSEDGDVLKFEPPYREEEQTTFNIPGTDQRARTERAAIDDDQNRLYASSAIAPLPAAGAAEEQVRRKAIWQQNVLNYALDTLPPEDFRRWHNAYLQHCSNPRHWSVKEANRLSAEMKARKGGYRRPGAEHGSAA